MGMKILDLHGNLFKVKENKGILDIRVALVSPYFKDLTMIYTRDRLTDTVFILYTNFEDIFYGLFPDHFSKGGFYLIELNQIAYHEDKDIRMEYLYRHKR